MASNSKIKGWQSYPRNLSGVDIDGHEYNFESYCRQLTADSARLLVGVTDDINIKTIRIESKVFESIIEDRSKLESYLEDVDTDSGLNLILVPQQGSWGRLVVDEPSARKILTRLHAFPSVLDVIRSFGQRTGIEDDSAGGIYLRSNDSESIHETCYLVKQAEEHGRSESVEPWSIRQMGVYHRAGSGLGNTFLIVNPSRPFLKRLTCMQTHPERLSPEALHYMVLSCSMENWRWYISDLEKRYVNLRNKAQLTRVCDNGEPTSPFTNIGIDDAQEMQVLQDKCQHLAQVLSLDCEVLRLLPRHLAKLANGQAVNDRLQSLSSEGMIQANRIKMLLKRLDGTIELTRTVLDFRCLASLQHNSRMMTQMAGLTNIENAMMRELTEKATRDADAVKWLTFLTLIYLPASFVATMMGMGYITVQNNGRLFSIHFTGEFWIFLVLTVMFLFLTMGLYFYFIRRHGLRSKRVPEDQGIFKPGSSSSQ